MPVISIIIPTYNSSRVIARCLQTIAGQSFRDFEVLIIDGVSTDNTRSIVKQFPSINIRIYSEPDKGIYDAMNKGIALAKGEWLYFMGSDDQLYNNNVLQHVAKELTHRKNVVYGKVKLDGSNRWGRDGQFYGQKFMLYHLLRRNICHQAIFYKRKFLLDNELKYDIGIPISADWDLNLQAFQITRFNFVDITIAIFDASGISSIGPSDKYAEAIKDKYPHLTGRYRMNPISNFWVKALLPIQELVKRKSQ